MPAQSRAAWALIWQIPSGSQMQLLGRGSQEKMPCTGRNNPCPLTESRGSLVPGWMEELQARQADHHRPPTGNPEMSTRGSFLPRKLFSTSLTLPSCISAGKCGTVSTLHEEHTKKHLCVPSREWEGTNGFPNRRQSKKQALCSQSLLCSTQHLLPNSCHQLHPSQHSAGTPGTSQQECQEITTGKPWRKQAAGRD